MSTRRAFLSLLAAAPAAAQVAPRATPTIGMLVTNNPEIWREPMHAALAELGMVEETHYRIVFRSADGDVARLDALAAELVERKVGVIAALQTPAALAAQRATREIPIVVAVGDPVGTGLVSSLARPGGNITGFSSVTADFLGKQLELISEILPGTRRVGALANAPDPFSRVFIGQLERAAAIAGVGLELLPVAGPDGLEAAFDRLARSAIRVVVVQGSLPTRRIVDLALRHRIAAIADYRPFALAGGLASFSGSFDERNRQVAQYIVRILRGAKPAELPIVQATRFELVLNRLTAQAIGITLPASLLMRADEVIE